MDTSLAGTEPGSPRLRQALVLWLLDGDLREGPEGAGLLPTFYQQVSKYFNVVTTNTAILVYTS